MLQKLLKRWILVIVIFSCITTLILSISQAFSQTEQSLDEENKLAKSLQGYAYTVITEYDKTVNQYFPDLKSNFYFYADNYNITTLQSAQYGASVCFEPANITSFDSYNTSYPIEIGLFGGYLNQTSAIALDNSKCVMSNIAHNTTRGNFIEISGSSEIIFKNLTISQFDRQIHFTYLIMKATNNTSPWSNDTAKKDADEILYNDMRINLVTSEEIKQRYAEPELTRLLQDIITKFGDSSQVYPLTQWKSDLQNLEQIAKYKYYLASPTGFLNDLIIYLNERTAGIMPTIAPENTPTPSMNIPTSTLPLVSNPTPTNTTLSTASIKSGLTLNIGLTIVGSTCVLTLIVLGFLIVFQFIRGKLDDALWHMMFDDYVKDGFFGVFGLAGFSAIFIIAYQLYSLIEMILEGLAVGLGLVFGLGITALLIKVRKKIASLHPAKNQG